MLTSPDSETFRPRAESSEHSTKIQLSPSTWTTTKTTLSPDSALYKPAVTPTKNTRWTHNQNLELYELYMYLLIKAWP